MGYCEAIIISVIVGFIIGLSPICRGLSEHIISSSRYLPLSAMTGIFIAWFGLQITMKIHFLAFGIIVYFLYSKK
jgi:NitT/TauT family transport system permease protein